MRINHDITAEQVRLIGADGQQIGVISRDDAQSRADALDLDLVEISGDTKPVVCKLLDYGKYKYRESKKRQEARTRQKHVEIKEIKFRLSTGEADYAVKLRNAVRFLEDGNRVKAVIAFRGREVYKQSMGRERLDKLRQDLAEVAEVERPPMMEGRRMQMFFMQKNDKRRQHAKNENK
ncbi:MAG: translation initiation factor IF-3 [Gammaproteobacteria bacterium]